MRSSKGKERKSGMTRNFWRLLKAEEDEEGARDRCTSKFQLHKQQLLRNIFRQQ